MSNLKMDSGYEYNTAKLWQIAFFTLNNTATNLYMFAIGFVSYYATGIAGLSVVVVSTILTLMRVFDGITDPIIGFFIDKLESKFGKFRPMMIMGNIILAGTLLIMYNVTHLLPESMQFLFFVFIYAIYIIGYTMQTACTKAAQTVLTNHPKQRPLFSVFDASYNIAIFTGGQIFVASYLVVKHGDFNQGLFTELNTYAIILSGMFTILAVIALWNKDRKEFYGLAEESVQTRFRDYWPILKGNRPMQMLVLAASTDKLASSLIRQPAVIIMFFGIMLGDYALSGTISLITIVPSLLITFIGVRHATRAGLKSTLVRATWLGLISFSLLAIFLLVIEPSAISLTNIGITTIIFLILYSLGMGSTSLTPAIVIPMIADVSDYETYKTGRYVPGMMGTIFSFVDKLISSLAPALVGFLLFFIGYRDEFPQLGETLTVALLIMTLVMKFGIPILGWICTLIAMKYYDLDDKRMKEIQTAIAEIKNNAKENNDNPKRVV
ncbi:MFS transporter [Oceanobacillus rekensis]|uniref:MFS transporter n=1 Tax=Oceanobacillus rekensis TaxID=937927 RepID=UPI000B433631|nr:MFS transporter [Oceanobacillus rekensis]